MVLKRAYGILLVCVVLLLWQCKEPFKPNIIDVDTNYLVVEGVIIGQQGTTSIKLSRTVKLSDTLSSRPELGATVFIENDQHTQYPLVADNKGTYTSTVLNLPAGLQYRLHIFTQDGKEYASDYVPMKLTPPIDSLTYTPVGSGKADDNGIQIYVNTHDATNATRYYRWEYNESWEYTSNYASLLEYKNYQVTSINPDSNRHYCYRFYTPPNGIYVGSSTQLSQDVITHHPINFATAASGKISIMYCVQMKQYAVTKEAYNYWLQLKKNTEQRGSIFDAQPSTLDNNVHCLSNSKEVVLGYISASSVASKLLFVTPQGFPFYIPALVNSYTCDLKAVLFNPNSTYNIRAEKAFLKGDSIPVELIQPRNSPPLGYTYAPKECVDCRLQGGTIVRPSYWPK